VTPKPPDGVARRKKPKPCSDAPRASVPQALAPVVPARTTPQASTNGAASAPTNALPSALAALPALAAPAAPIAASSVLHAVPLAEGDPTAITVKHWRRILDGELLATSSRVEWAVLLRRTYGVDALRCPRCAARMRVLATITEPSVVQKLLSHLGLRTEPLPRGRARDPTGQESFDFDAA
jgi:hypothetical protein